MNARHSLELGPFFALTPERLTINISHYRTKAAELDSKTRPRETTMRRLYQTLAMSREGLLAALRNGQPELWSEYTPGEAPRDAPS